MSAYTAIASQTLTVAASSVTFSSIPQDFRDLVISIDGTPSTSASLFFRFNSDSGNNYPFVLMEGHPTLGPRSASTTGSNLSIGFVTVKFSAQASVMDYAVTDKHKSTLSRSGEADRVNATAGRWANTDAINTVLVGVSSGTFNVGSVISIYGVSA